MRQPLEQNGAPLGIRGGIWFGTFGVALVCLITIGLSLRQKNQPTTDTVREGVTDQLSAGPPRVRERVKTGITFTPRIAYDEPNSGTELMSAVEQAAQDRQTWMDQPGFQP